MNRRRTRSLARATGVAAVRVGSAAAAALTLHTLVNLRLMRTLPASSSIIAEPVSVLLPARNEAGRVGPCIGSLRAQRDVRSLEILVLDDGSTDGTAAVVREALGDDPRSRLLTGTQLPAGWLGKPHACAQLAAAAKGTVLVFVDADVRLAPDAISRTVALLRTLELDLLCPYPRQQTLTLGERLVQPLLQWSWLTTLPLRWAEKSATPSLSAANGQLLAVDASAYQRAGGHAAVRDQVLEDLALLKAVKRSGGHGVVADGTAIASCRMYETWRELRQGYEKSLWSAFGSPLGAVAAIAGLAVVYVVPPVAALAGSRVGAVGYAAGVAGRVAVARRTGGRGWPDSLAHPLSIVALGWLTARSFRARRRNSLTWKGRSLG